MNIPANNLHPVNNKYCFYYAFCHGTTSLNILLVTSQKQTLFVSSSCVAGLVKCNSFAYNVYIGSSASTPPHCTRPFICRFKAENNHISNKISTNAPNRTTYARYNMMDGWTSFETFPCRPNRFFPCCVDKVRRRSRRTFSTRFEIFRRHFDGVVIFFFDCDFQFFNDASEFSVTSLYVVFFLQSSCQFFFKSGFYRNHGYS